MVFWYGFFALLVAEIITFGIVADEIGFFGTLGLCFLSALAGGLLVKMQGMVTLTRAQESLDRGITPMGALFDGICLFAAGMLFIFPGFVSDLLALCLLVPQIRHILRQHGAKFFNLKEQDLHPRDDGVIDVVYERVEEKPQQLPKDSL